MTKNASLLILLSLLAILVHAESDNVRFGTLHGKVKSKGENLPFVTVYASGTTQGTSTDAQGKFALSLRAGEYTIKVQGVGFKTKAFPLNIKGNESIEMDLELEQDIVLMDQVVVTGSRIGLLKFLPGSATTVGAETIQRTGVISSNEIFQMVPGIHAVEEEGVGLRANIGIRGLDPDKSRTVLMLEDGIPVALGPYGEPEMYFTPSVDRMKGVEILKGNGQIRFGPQTIGGVINYITADPPSSPEGLLQLRGGQGGFFSGLFQHGSSFGNTGYTFNYLHKQADAIGPTRFRLDDLNGKIRIKSGIRSTLQLKWSVYNEVSNSSYVGITQAMYDQGGQDYQIIAPNDKLDVRRYAFSAVHDYLLRDRWTFSTLAYGYTTTRNWMRQDFTYSSTASNLTGVMFGDPTQPEGAIYMRNSTGNRNRQFEVAGIEPRLKGYYSIANINNQLDAGLRFHYERAFEQRVNGKNAEALSGDLRDDEIRTGLAYSAYAQNKMMFSDNFTLTYGIRAEVIDYERQILRTAGKDTTIVAATFVADIIPGMGVNYNFNEQFGFFAGVHKGFAPPRIKDAISNSGVDLELDAEHSWNFEAGTRFQLNDILNSELTLFHMNFANQIIPVSESSGGAGAGLVNGGETVHNGVELSLALQLDQWMPGNFKANAGFNVTYVDAKFSSDRFIESKIRRTAPRDTIFVNVKGNATPYAPQWLLNAFANIETTFGLGGMVQVYYTGKQFTDVLNTVDVYTHIESQKADPDYRHLQASASGRFGQLSSYMLLNASLWYKLNNTGIEFSLNAKNLLDERYIVSRRPQGIRVGLGRYIMAGVTYRF